MADPKEQHHETKVEETAIPTDDSELTDADFEKVAGGTIIDSDICTIATYYCK